MEVRWPDSVRRLLIAQCSVAGLLQLGIALRDLSEYAVDIPGAFSVLFWILSGAISWFAALGMATRADWFAAPLLIAEVMILVSCGFVLWADFTSPFPDWPVRGPAIVLGLVAVPVIPPLASRLTALPGKAWATGLALLSGLGGTQFVVENFVLPGRSAPVVEISASLEEVGRTADSTQVRGVVSWKNVGGATAWVPQVFASVTSSGDGSASPAELDPQQVTDTFNPLSTDGREFTRELPGSGAGIVWLDDLAPYPSALPPGVSEHREFALSVGRDQAQTLELQVHLTALTNALGGDARTCDGGSTALDEDFLDGFRAPVVVDDWTSSCLEVPIRSRNSVRALTSDEPSIVMGYAFSAPRDEWRGPLVYYATGESDLSDPADFRRAGERFERRNPSLVLTYVAVLPVPANPGDATCTTTCPTG